MYRPEPWSNILDNAQSSQYPTRTHSTDPWRQLFNGLLCARANHDKRPHLQTDRWIQHRRDQLRISAGGLPVRNPAGARPVPLRPASQHPQPDRLRTPPLPQPRRVQRHPAVLVRPREHHTHIPGLGVEFRQLDKGWNQVGQGQRVGVSGDWLTWRTRQAG